MSAANLPVIRETGNPDGLNVHCPAWYTSGSGVLIDLAILARRFSTGIGQLVYDHPVIAPLVVPAALWMVSGVEVKLSMTASVKPG